MPFVHACRSFTRARKKQKSCVTRMSVTTARKSVIRNDWKISNDFAGLQTCRATFRVSSPRLGRGANYIRTYLYASLDIFANRENNTLIRRNSITRNSRRFSTRIEMLSCLSLHYRRLIVGYYYLTFTTRPAGGKTSFHSIETFSNCIRPISENGN